MKGGYFGRQCPGCCLYDISWEEDVENPPLVECAKCNAELNELGPIEIEKIEDFMDALFDTEEE